jgi:hypothetical protein
MFVLVGLEIRTLYLDRDEHDREQAYAACEQLERFGQIADKMNTAISTSQSQFNATMDKFSGDEQVQQQQFNATMRAFGEAQISENNHFAGILGKQQQAFEEQRDLSEELHGRLVPGDSPTPSNACSKFYQPKDGEVTLIIGDSADITGTFPHTFLSIGGFPVLSVDRVSSSSEDLSLSVDLRDQSNRIAFRMNKDGVVNKTNLILLHPDKSTLLLQDEYGVDIFRARFLNPKVFEVSGKVSYCGQLLPVQNPMIHGYCSAFNGGDIAYGAPPCPKPQ